MYQTFCPLQQTFTATPRPPNLKCQLPSLPSVYRCIIVFVTNFWYRLRNHVSCRLQHKGHPCSPSSETVMTVLMGFSQVSFSSCYPGWFNSELCDLKVGLREKEWIICQKKWEWSVWFVPFCVLYDDVFCRLHIYSVCRLPHLLSDIWCCSHQQGWLPALADLGHVLDCALQCCTHFAWSTDLDTDSVLPDHPVFSVLKWIPPLTSLTNSYSQSKSYFYLLQKILPNQPTVRPMFSLVINVPP